MDSHLAKLRGVNQRARFRNNQRVLRQKEEIVLMSCEQALDSTNIDTITNAVRMADALIKAVGIHVLHSDLIRTFVAVRKWGKEIGGSKRYLGGLYPSTQQKDPNFHPCTWRRKDLVHEYLKDSTKQTKGTKGTRKKQPNGKEKTRHNVLHHSGGGPVEGVNYKRKEDPSTLPS